MGAAQMMADESPKARLQREIDENLKRVYDDVLRQEIPDRFKELLARLKEKEGKRDPSDS
jgi:Anti-sigma factor NepR